MIWTDDRRLGHATGNRQNKKNAGQSISTEVLEMTWTGIESRYLPACELLSLWPEKPFGLFPGMAWTDFTVRLQTWAETFPR